MAKRRRKHPRADLVRRVKAAIDALAEQLARRGTLELADTNERGMGGRFVTSFDPAVQTLLSLARELDRVDPAFAKSVRDLVAMVDDLRTDAIVRSLQDRGLVLVPKPGTRLVAIVSVREFDARLNAMLDVFVRVLTKRGLDVDEWLYESARETLATLPGRKSFEASYQEALANGILAYRSRHHARPWSKKKGRSTILAILVALGGWAQGKAIDVVAKRALAELVALLPDANAEKTAIPEGPRDSAIAPPTTPRRRRRRGKA